MQISGRSRRLLIRLVLAYVAVCVVLVAFERRILYQPFPGPKTPEQAQLTGYTLQHFTATDGLSIPYWEHRSKTGPVVLYFHGNGGGLYAFTDALRYLAEQDFTVMAMEYRGYGTAPGKPSEAALVADAVALHDHAKTSFPTRRVAAWGYSLGSGVATQLAAKRRLSAVVLEAPFSATVDRAVMLYPFLPVRWLMRDQFLSREAIGNVHAPVLIMHGEADRIIPIGLAEQLFERANAPKQFLRYPQVGHFDLIDTPAYDAATQWLQHNESGGRTP